ncbi:MULTISPECIES: PilZ domain-containing protein [Actinoplanes]|uniref:PilZ domain-containing protein n=1 Tax=Actinoplanes TaxID=1865 RepID=UPI0005F2DFD6|nr:MULTISPECIES: PilZ domain-containing protein [Actinoplanes]GLY02953.1 hypothetical protein Acsp01_33320 [Actinoplanes sp. NBRC 101535]
MVRAVGVPREAVDVVQEQPLPWRAAAVYVSFGGGSARTCQVTRHPGDVLRVELPGLAAEIGTQAEVQWTQDGRGGYACGTVVPVADGEAPGVYIRVDESVSGVERRLGVRVPVRIPATMAVASDRVYPGHTDDLSTGGAHVTLNPAVIGEELVRQFAAELASGAHLVAELHLPDGVARLTCLVAATGGQPGDVRLKFVDVDNRTEERLDAFLRRAQRRIPMF